MSITATVSPSLNRRITKGIERGMQEIIDNMKKELINAENNISIYSDEGKRLSTLLKRNGLDITMNPGSLRKAWEKTVNDIKLEPNLSFKIFDSTIMDRETPWMGLTYNPDDNKRKSKKQIIREDARVNNTSNINFVAGPYSGIVKDGYRPLPSRGSFKWSTNPYPDRGYWMIYDQGYLSNGISYVPSNFIKTGLYNILGESVGRLYAYDNNMKFSSRIINKIEKAIAKSINTIK